MFIDMFIRPDGAPRFTPFFVRHLGGLHGHRPSHTGPPYRSLTVLGLIFRARCDVRLGASERWRNGFGQFLTRFLRS